MVYIKSQEDLQLIRKACEIWKKTREILIKATKPGVSLKELDQLAYQTITSLNGKCAFYHLYGFPGHICISVNEQLIHGVPNDYVLKSNDMVTFDVGVCYERHFCDSAFTVIVEPQTNLVAKQISDVTYDALMNAIKIIKPGIKVNDIANEIYQTAMSNHYEVIKDFGGHGCGNFVHEDPIILNYPHVDGDFVLKENMVICIEPMLMTGSDKYVIDPKNKWTVSSRNKLLTCHWEHMVLVTKDGYEILTI